MHNFNRRKHNGCVRNYDPGRRRLPCSENHAASSHLGMRLCNTSGYSCQILVFHICSQCMSWSDSPGPPQCPNCIWPWSSRMLGLVVLCSPGNVECGPNSKFKSNWSPGSLGWSKAGCWRSSRFCKCTGNYWISCLCCWCSSRLLMCGFNVYTGWPPVGLGWNWTGCCCPYGLDRCAGNCCGPSRLFSLLLLCQLVTQFLNCWLMRGACGNLLALLFCCERVCVSNCQMLVILLLLLLWLVRMVRNKCVQLCIWCANAQSFATSWMEMVIALPFVLAGWLP